MASVATRTQLRSIRRYHPPRDLQWLQGLWRRAMPARWSLSSPELHNVLSKAALTLVAEQAGTPVGFCAVAYKEQGPSGILVILVEPAVQRSGVGSTLLKQMEQTLKTCKVDQLRVGFGNDGNYFWPGVPIDCNAWNFFTAKGWQEHEPNHDLVQELSSYTTPLWVRARLAAAEIRLHLAKPDLRKQILAFEQRWFPLWADFYVKATTDPAERNIVVALDSEGAVVGAVLLSVAESGKWAADSGVRHGTINVLGVAEDRQGQGIGIALAARAMEILKKRGCIKCYVQWTGLVNWYGKLGTKVWAEYHTASKELC